MIAYNTMARRSELVSLMFEDIDYTQSNTGIYLRRSKVDQEGSGPVAPNLNKDTTHDYQVAESVRRKNRVYPEKSE